MTDAGFVFGGYLATAAVICSYAGWMVRRRRALSRLLEPDDQ
jgi:hypothetical protein